MFENARTGVLERKAAPTELSQISYGLVSQCNDFIISLSSTPSLSCFTLLHNGSVLRDFVQAPSVRWPRRLTGNYRFWHKLAVAK